MHRCLINGGGYVKHKGRAMCGRVVAACCFITPEYLTLGTEKYEVDRRAVVVPATKGRIVRCRPRLDDWGIKFVLEWDNTLLSTVQMREILDCAGSRVGLLDFRPEKKGPYGRFRVDGFDEIKDSA